MQFSVGSTNSNIYPQTFFKKKNVTFTQQKKEEENPISERGEAVNLIKATFVAGIGVGARLLWEIWDCDFLFETAGKKQKKLLIKISKKQIKIKKCYYMQVLQQPLLQQLLVVSHFYIQYQMLRKLLIRAR